MDENKKQSNISCICKFCLTRNVNSSIEINFLKQSIFYVCEKCNKDNEIKLKQQKNSLPRIRRI